MTIEEATLRIFSIVTPRSINVLETLKTSPHKVNGGLDGRGVLDRLIIIMIECVLRGLNSPQFSSLVKKRLHIMCQQ